MENLEKLSLMSLSVLCVVMLWFYSSSERTSDGKGGNQVGKTHKAVMSLLCEAVSASCG